MKKALKYFLVFVVLQVLVTSLIKLVSKYALSESISNVHQSIAISLLSGVVIVCLFVKLRWVDTSADYLRSRPWGVFIWSILASLGMILPSVWLQEFLPPLPDMLAEMMTEVMRQPLGYLVVGVFAPVMEEMVFRGAILAALLAVTPRSWYAILLSALVFSLIHLNPAQMPHAFVGGVLLGWLYVRTGSILPGVVFHWTNNTAAYIMCNIMPDPNIKLSEFFHDDTQKILLAVFFSLCIFIPSILQLNRLMKKVKSE